MPMVAWLLTGLALIIVSSNHNAAFFLGAALVALIYAIPFWVAFLCLKINIANWPPEAYGGSKLPFSLAVNNSWPLPIINIKAQLVLQNTLNQSYETVELVIDIKPLSKSRITWEAGPLPRGLYNLVSLRLNGYAPFELISWSRQEQLEGTVKVFPLLLPVAARYGLNGYAGLRQKPALSNNSGTLHDGIRSYNPGDSLSRIHWKVSASHGQLLSKSFTEEKGGTKVLVAAYWGNSQAANEALITAAASMAWAWFQQGTEFYFILYAREHHNLGIILTQENLEQLMQILTVAMPSTEDNVKEGLVSYVLQSLEAGSGEIILLTGEEEFEVPNAWLQAGCSTVVVPLQIGLSAEGIVEVLEGVA